MSKLFRLYGEYMLSEKELEKLKDKVVLKLAYYLSFIENDIRLGDSRNVYHNASKLAHLGRLLLGENLL
jgi:hypothetical protein